MKRITLALVMLFTLTTVAQSNSINYKALIKDANNAVVASTQVTVQFQILQGGAQTNVYQETHTPTTDANGIIIINIGDGVVNSGVFANIDWSSDDHFLNTQINSGSGLTDMGTTDFNAVPYALSAKTVENITETDPKVTSATTNTVPKWDGTNLIDGSINDVDGDIGIGTTSPDPSAQLDLSSTTKGFLPPRMTDSQKNFMDNPAAGLIVYCSDCGPDGQMQMFNGTIWTDMIGGSTVGGPAAIGDKRAGGVVFWVDPTDNTHGLVCALSDYTGIEVWGCYPTDLPNVPNVPWNGASTVGLGAEIGDGQSNTANMLIDCPTSPAALAARSLGLEWFLPSILELNEMYNNRATLEAVAGFNAFVSIGGINNTKYWSSTEFNANWSHNFSFLDGGFNYNNKSTSILRVRAARAF